MRIRIVATALFLTLFTFSTAFAQRSRSLNIGSPAPGLNVEWVQGDFNPATAEVYVVEFWATWCAPCRKSVPHLTKLQEEFGEDGLTIVGISIDEDTELVEPFVKRQGMKMGYTVGVDNRKKTQRAWMDAAGQKGIPSAFIVDREGIIQYIGNPLQDTFEDVLVKVMSGRYNLLKQIEAEPSILAAESSRNGNSWAEATKAYENAIKIDKIVFAELYLEQLEMLLVDKKDPAAAYAFVNKVIIDRGSEDPVLLTWIADYIAADEEIPESSRRMDVAMHAAKTALTFARRKTDPLYLATIAFVHFNNGNVDEAIEWQRKAYFSAREKNKSTYKFDLDRYQNQKQRADASE
jgi:thiol-disulfide isomerase/thioredoxin